MIKITITMNYSLSQFLILLPLSLRCLALFTRVHFWMLDAGCWFVTLAPLCFL